MLIQEVVEAMTAAQDQGFKVLAFVVPVLPDALESSGWSATALENEVQDVLTRTLSTMLVMGPGNRSEPSDNVPL